jgi:molybdopterin-guanine dinucleotide biosynthesis protein A
MGTDKAQLQHGDATLLDRAIATAQAAGFAVTVSVAADSQLSEQLAARGISVVMDKDPELGPLGGITAALEGLAAYSSSSQPVLFMPVDVPRLPAEFLSWLWRRALSIDAQAAISLVDGREQPLCAVYASALARPLRQQLGNGERKVMRALRQVVPADSLDCFDVEAVAPVMGWFRPDRWFTNVNTPEEWVAMREDTLRGDRTPSRI